VPTYLRWIAAMTAGISIYFTYTILTYAVFKANDVDTVGKGVGGLVALGAYLWTMLAVLAVNDWLAKRYPTPQGPRKRAEDETSVK
jgi:hypothetical protein